MSIEEAYISPSFSSNTIVKRRRQYNIAILFVVVRLRSKFKPDQG